MNRKVMFLGLVAGFGRADEAEDRIRDEEVRVEIWPGVAHNRAVATVMCLGAGLWKLQKALPYCHIYR